MTDQQLQDTIETAWEGRDSVGPTTGGDVRAAVDAALDGLDEGRFRVAEKIDGAWRVNQWLKKAVLLSFRLNDMVPMGGGPGGGTRSEEHTSELQSLMRISYAVFCLKKKKKKSRLDALHTR